MMLLFAINGNILRIAKPVDLAGAVDVSRVRAVLPIAQIDKHFGIRMASAGLTTASVPFIGRTVACISLLVPPALTAVIFKYLAFYVQ